MQVTVIGAGNGGQTSAVHLAHMGHNVRLYDRFPEVIAPLSHDRQLRAVGAIEAKATIDLVTSDMEEAVDGAELVLVTLPSFTLDYVATELARHLHGGETVILHPGGVGGSLEVRKIWDRLNVPRTVILAETDTLQYACRLREPGYVHVSAVKLQILLAALPSGNTAAAARKLQLVYPNVRAADSIFETGLSNINPVLHPSIALLNAGRIDTQDTSFIFYRDGVTPGVARLIDAIDRERCAIAKAFGLHVPPLRDIVMRCYGIRKPTIPELYKTLSERIYQGIGTPSGLNARYITEDVPFGLVPLTELGALVGCATPTMQGIIAVASAIGETDYVSRGRTLERMGIDGLSKQGALELVTQTPGARGEA